MAMEKTQNMNGNRQPRYGSDLIVDIMGGLEIEYAAVSPGATFRGIHGSILN
jgi:acetolactate synthase I/II/III large subunit